MDLGYILVSFGDPGGGLFLIFEGPGDSSKFIDFGSGPGDPQDPATPARGGEKVGFWGLTANNQIAVGYQETTR